MGKKTHLIVTGVARSGTTALAELLNAHPAICLGVERFKFRYLREHSYSREFLTHERFFDFQPGDTNLLPEARPAWAPLYESIAEKWDAAMVIGDKTPDMIPILSEFMAQNPDYKYICILRNLKDVGLSWQARAERKRDAWPRGRGFVAACESWSLQQQTLHDMVRDKRVRKQLLLLDYDKMYDDVDTTEHGLLQFLGVPADPEFRSVLLSHAEFASGRGARKVPPKFADAYSEINMGPARGLRKVAREQIDLLAKEYNAQQSAAQ